MSERRLRIGVAGLGRAFSLMLPTFARHPLVEVVAGTDPRPEARVRFGQDFPAAAAYATVDNDGIYCTPIPVISITDVNGNKLDVANPQCHQAIPADIAHAALSAARCPVW